MTIDQMIKKWKMELATKNGEEGIGCRGKMTPAQKEMVKEAKPEIMAELKRRKEEAQAEAERQAAKRKAERQSRLEAYKNGTEKIKLHYQDGEYLMGYSVSGEAAELLGELGLCEYVTYWGHHVKKAVVEALGEEFTYQEALAFAQPAMEEKADKEAQKEAEKQAKFAEAKATGKPVLLKQWSEECCNPKEECSLDMHYEYALPDGSTKHEWQHTW